MTSYLVFVKDPATGGEGVIATKAEGRNRAHRLAQEQAKRIYGWQTVAIEDSMRLPAATNQRTLQELDAMVRQARESEVPEEVEA